MASTFTPYQAFEYAKILIKNMELEKISYRTLDDALKIMWMAAPWRWTVGSMPTVTLAANTQDYTIAVPGDFLYLLKAELTDGLTAPRDLKVEPTLPTSVTVKGQPNHVAVVGTNFRFAPQPGSVTNPAPTLVSLYKKSAPIITKANMATQGIQVFDDEWFWVYQEGVLWRSYLYADDSRAGSATYSTKAGVEYTGQRAVFEAALAQMKSSEPIIPLMEKRDGMQ